MLSIYLLAHLMITTPATALSVVGTVEVETTAGKSALLPLAAVAEGATVVTHENSRVSLRLQSGSLVRLGPKSRVLLTQLESGKPAAARRERVKLLVGRMWARVMGLFGQDSHFEIETTSAVAGIRGTALWVQSEPGADRFVLEKGALEVRQGDHTVQLDGMGASAVIGPGGVIFDGFASDYVLEGLRGEVGGPAAQMLHRTDPLVAPHLAVDANRQFFRRAINPPDNVVDTPFGIATPADELRGLANVTVRITVP
jgi:hypothetical protein